MAINEIMLRTPMGAKAIPQLGLGVWQIPDDEVEQAIATAVDTGYRHIDTAKIYQNEAGVGRAIAATEVSRDDLFVTTKLWNSDQGTDLAPAALEASLDRLGLDRLDLYLIHWPAPANGKFVESWEALRALRDAGRTEAIGVSNFTIEHLQQLFDATGEWPSINQVELHPYLQQQELREFHAEHDIVTEAWSPLGQGGDLLTEPVLTDIAARVGATPAQVVLRWHLDLGNVTIPKSATPSRIAENFLASELSLTDEDRAAIAGLDRNGRIGPDPNEFAG